MGCEVLNHVLSLLGQGVLSVDEEGRIWRHSNRLSHSTRALPTPRRAENVGHKGYLRVAVWLGGKVRNVAAHRVVWAQANGDIPRGLEINHIDGSKTNNALSNLELVTPKQNAEHAIRTGLHGKTWSVKGKENQEWRPGKRLLTDKDRQDIATRKAAGEHARVIALDYDITVAYVHMVAAMFRVSEETCSTAR